MTALLDVPTASSVDRMLICADRAPHGENTLLRTGIQQLAAENARLRAENERLARRLRDAQARIDYDQATAHRHHHQEK